ncbi:hypothetical protein chiPu_0030930, partial [Chiloscyllium punctatum]|nr:hypothetical protein [Chiloscyllium punctatum]
RRAGVDDVQLARRGRGLRRQQLGDTGEILRQHGRQRAGVELQLVVLVERQAEIGHRHAVHGPAQHLLELGHDIAHRAVAEQHGARCGRAVGVLRGLCDHLVAKRIVVGDEGLQRRGDLAGVGLDADVQAGAARRRLQQIEGDAGEHVGNIVGVAGKRDAVEAELRGLRLLQHIGEGPRRVGDAELVHDVVARGRRIGDVGGILGPRQHHLIGPARHLDDRGLDVGGRGLGI